MRKSMLISAPLAVLAFSLLAGCSSSPTVRLYLLEPITGSVGARASQPLTITVESVRLAEHLNRNEILTRDAPYRVSAAEYDRWAEPLDYNIAAVLAENLALLVPTDSVHTYPGDAAYQADYSVRVHILRFGTQSNNEVVLWADWMIEDSSGSSVKQRRSRYSERRRDSEMVSMVEALSRNVEQLSRDIANAINEVNLASNTQN